MFFTSSGVDEDGNPIRDPHSTTYTGAIETAEEFARRIYHEAFQRGWSRAKIKVILGDGAIWIWNLAADQFPGAILIVDFYHAAEHLHKVSRLLFSGDEAARLRWVSCLVDQLKAGDIESIVATLRSFATERPDLADKLTTEAEYFERNAEKCAIPSFASRDSSSAPASSKPAASPSSAPDSSNLACSGRSKAPTESSPFAAAASAAGLRISGKGRRLPSLGVTFETHTPPISLAGDFTHPDGNQFARLNIDQKPLVLPAVDRKLRKGGKGVKVSRQAKSNLPNLSTLIGIPFDFLKAGRGTEKFGGFFFGELNSFLRVNHPIPVSFIVSRFWLVRGICG